MIDLEEYKKYLVYTEEGKAIGVKSDAPQKVKIALRNYIVQEKDKERLRKQFTENT